MPPNHVLITGCSGGGKSTLLTALGRRGFETVPEPGRRIVAEAQSDTDHILPWINPMSFAKRALDMARDDIARHSAAKNVVFFDRGLIDAAVALDHTGGAPLTETLAGLPRYADLVFLAPPWRSIFRREAARRHDFDAAVAEYDRISQVLKAMGYRSCVLPKASVAQRVAFVLDALGLA